MSREHWGKGKHMKLELEEKWMWGEGGKQRWIRKIVKLVLGKIIKGEAERRKIKKEC